MKTVEGKEEQSKEDPRCKEGNLLTFLFCVTIPIQKWTLMMKVIITFYLLIVQTKAGDAAKKKK